MGAATVCLLVLLAIPALAQDSDYAPYLDMRTGFLAARKHHPHPDRGRKLGNVNFMEAFQTNGNSYKPQNKDWASVISAVRGIGKIEKRMYNFAIRACFHDGMAVDLGAHHGGMDGSLWLQIEKHDGSNEGFIEMIHRGVVTVANKYGTSMADTLAIFGAVAIEELTHGRIRIIGRGSQKNKPNIKNFPVGRIDATQTSGGAFCPDNAQVSEFGKWWNDRGFSTEEGIALLGAHSLFDNQGCTKSSTQGDMCDPTKGDCTSQVRSFRLDNHYYRNLCTGPINFLDPVGPAPPFDANAMADLKKQAMCGIQSDHYRQARFVGLESAQQNGDHLKPKFIDWSSANCQADRKKGIVVDQCPHINFWTFTISDAFLGRACQGQDFDKNQVYGPLVQKAMKKFLDENQWEQAFPQAFIKMVSVFAQWTGGRSTQINGLECPSGYIVDSSCAKSKKVSTDAKKQCGNCWNVPAGESGCNQCCRCKTAWTDRDHLDPESIDDVYFSSSTGEV